MSLASPDRLIWLWVALPIIGFYILKTRLRRRPVATLLFWDQLFEEKRQRSLWQNLRHWLSLLLQLIFVGLLAFALGDPLWRFQTDSKQQLILVVDNSASMQATNATTGQTRLAEAIERAGEVAAGLRQGDEIALVSAGSSVRVVVGMTDFAPAIQDGLETIEATDGPTRVEQSIEAARRLANDPERRRIVVFSDACLRDRDQIEVGGDLKWVQVGESRDNAAITTFQVRRSTVDPIGYALLIEVQNFSDEAIKGRLTLQLDEALVDVLPVSLEPNGSWRRTIDAASREGGVLVGTFDLDDALAVDNVARAIVPSRPLVPVTLMSDEESESFYLRTVFQSIPLLELTVASESESPVEGTSDQLTVFSGLAAKQLPRGPTLIVGASEDGPPLGDSGEPAWRLGEPIDSPIIAKQDKESPLLRHVQLQNVLLDGARDIEVNESLGEATTLLETADGARVLVSVERASGRVLILSADLDASDLPLRIAFPVMMTNAMNWFFRQTGEMNPALATGEISRVPWDVATGKETDASEQLVATEAVLVNPSGDRRSVTVSQRQASVGPLAGVGVYGLFTSESLPTLAESEGEDKTPPRELTEGEASVDGELLAVNLCDANESDLRLPQLSEQAVGNPPPGGAPAWFYLVLLAIGLVLGEWALFNRRVVA